MPLDSHQEIRILHVDDDPEFTDLTETFLEREDDRFTIETATSADEGLQLITDRPPDCVVSDYNMPGMDGLEFLQAVREEYSALPFILFTGKGSETVASDAISAGVTDYLQKSSGTEQYELLATRIDTAVSQYRAERELERQNDLFTKAQDIANVGAWEYDIRTEELRWTAEVYEIHDLPTDTAVTLGEAIEFYHPQDQPAIREAIDRAIKGGDSYDVELRLTAGGDDHRWIRTRGEPQFEDGELVRIRGTIQDITERKRRERELKHQRDRYQSLFENTNDAVAWTEYNGDTPIIREANPRFQELFERSDEEVVGQPLDEVVTDPDHTDRRKRAEAISQRVKTGAHESGEFQRDTIDGPKTFLWEAIPYTPPGADGVQNSHAVYTDISARRASERELRQYQTLVEAVGDPMYLLDAEGNITMVNDAVIEQWGYPREECLQMHASEVMPDEDYERGSDLIRELLADPERTYGTFEMTSITADGEQRINETRIGVITDDNEYVGSAGVIRDITERKKREQELKRERDRLDQFASILSHDLRSPLNVASARLELASEECESAHLADVADALDRMETLIDDVLAIAREGTRVQETETVSLPKIAEGCWSVVKTDEATRHIDTEQRIQADPGRLKQLLENLMRNAIDHGGDDVTVTVSEMTNGFYVADDGPGIPSEKRAEVFEPGYSATDSGIGLGLNIVQEIAEAHGWEISVTNSADGGARFEITGVETK